MRKFKKKYMFTHSKYIINKEKFIFFYKLNKILIRDL